PGGGAARLQRLHVVDDLEQVAALGAFVDDFVEGVIAGAAGDAAEHGARHIGNIPRPQRKQGDGFVIHLRFLKMAAKKTIAEVHKFGGASLADAAAYKNAAAIVKGRKGPRAIVVSAPAGVTDKLLGLATRAAAGEKDGLDDEVKAL